MRSQRVRIAAFFLALLLAGPVVSLHAQEADSVPSIGEVVAALGLDDLDGHWRASRSVLPGRAGLNLATGGKWISNRDDVVRSTIFEGAHAILDIQVNGKQVPRELLTFQEVKEQSKGVATVLPIDLRYLAIDGENIVAVLLMDLQLNAPWSVEFALNVDGTPPRCSFQ